MLLSFKEQHPTDLAIYCSDGRFTGAVEHLLESLGLSGRPDEITLPGGPGLFSAWTGTLADKDVITAATTFLIENHGTKIVVLVAHEGCGFYKKRFPPPNAVEYIKALQISDLKKAAKQLRDAHPGIMVHSYFSDVQAGKVHFTKIED